MGDDIRGVRFSVPLSASADSSARNVAPRCTDGKVIVAGVFPVPEEDQAIIYDVVSTSRPDAPRTGATAVKLSQ
jgi:hypothetical protein